MIILKILRTFELEIAQSLVATSKNFKISAKVLESRNKNTSVRML